jgi:hypothetical protein
VSGKVHGESVSGVRGPGGEEGGPFEVDPAGPASGNGLDRLERRAVAPRALTRKLKLVGGFAEEGVTEDVESLCAGHAVIFARPGISAAIRDATDPRRGTTTPRPALRREGSFSGANLSTLDSALAKARERLQERPLGTLHSSCFPQHAPEIPDRDSLVIPVARRTVHRDHALEQAYRSTRIPPSQAATPARRRDSLAA